MVYTLGLFRNCVELFITNIRIVQKRDFVNYFREEEKSIARNSFIQLSKLSNVKGRIDYITNPERQENLYATYETVQRNFWKSLAIENQQDFQKSGSAGKCIEARELIIALPESFIKYQPEKLLKIFTEKFKQKYGVECVSALHHNKKKTNYHIHLIFSERELLEKEEFKTASRNLFYNENGKRVRTKKEIQNELGEIRKGCTIIPKGEIYEKHSFGNKRVCFKDVEFLPEIKKYYTNMINYYVKNPTEKLTVFDRDSVYIATKKIGKNNPKAEQIKKDNNIRQEWNKIADMALVVGISDKRIKMIKRNEITEKIQRSMKMEGWKPELFYQIMVNANGILKDVIQKHKMQLKPTLNVDIEQFKKMEALSLKLHRQVEEIQKLENVELPKLEKELKNIRGFFKGKQKRILQQKIEDCKENINVSKENLQEMVHQQGYKDVQTFLKAYSKSKKIVEQWKKEKHTEKESIIEKLKELKKEASLYKQNIKQYKSRER